MKRDMDLIREVMFVLERMTGTGHRTINGSDQAFGEVEASAALINYNLRLLVQKGLVDGAVMPANMGFMITGLTWAGHDFLDSIRDDEIWRKTKEGAEKAGGFTVDILGDLAKGFIKTQIKKYTGVVIPD